MKRPSGSQCPGGGVNLNAKFEVPSSPDEYFQLTPTSNGNLYGTPLLRSLPEGSIDLVIPLSINGVVAKAIGNQAFDGYKCIRSVIIPIGITSIGSKSFSACSNLVSIVIPVGISYIGNYTFSSNIALTSIDLPSSIETIGTNAFNACTALTEININRRSGTVSGSPWGKNSAKINWLG